MKNFIGALVGAGLFTFFFMVFGYFIVAIIDGTKFREHYKGWTYKARGNYRSAPGEDDFIEKGKHVCHILCIPVFIILFIVFMVYLKNY